METQLIDGNNVFTTLAQSLAADKRSVHAAYDLDSIRKMVVHYISKHIQAGRPVVIAADAASWRKQEFPPYKWRRYQNKGRDDFKYDEFIVVLQKVLEEIKEHSPCAVLRVPGAEGDDIIAAFAAIMAEEGGVCIHSTDKDLLQLQLHYSGVRQFSPTEWKYITAQSKGYSLIEHIIRGDAGDDVPNILSADDVFMTKTRQTVLTASRYSEMYALLSSERPEDQMDDEQKRRYHRNRKLIDLREIPFDVVERIFAAYTEEKEKMRPAGAFSHYLASHGIL